MAPPAVLGGGGARPGYAHAPQLDLLPAGLAHAYLFCGPRGTGKTTLGRLLAKAANCSGPADGEPCNECDSCVAFNEGRAMDFVEQDAASHNSVDDIRQLRENVVLSADGGRAEGLPAGRGAHAQHRREERSAEDAGRAAAAHHLRPGDDGSAQARRDDHLALPAVRPAPHPDDGGRRAACGRSARRRATRLRRRRSRRSLGARPGACATRSTGSSKSSLTTATSPAIEQVREALGLNVDARSGELARLALSGDLAGGLKLIAAVRDDGADMKNFNKQVGGYLRNLLLAKIGRARGAGPAARGGGGGEGSSASDSTAARSCGC